MESYRLFQRAVASGARNMAADEALLESASAGAASLRFYTWDEPTVSLGYFQPAAVRAVDPLLSPLPFVRRPSGGMTLVHDRELTYALALPPGPPWQGGGSCLCLMHRVIAAALATFGVEARLHTPTPGEHFDGPLCFRHHTEGDLLLQGHKIVGSAQRKVRGALLQHGGILLEKSPHAPSLPGVFDLTGRRVAAAELADAVARAFIRETGATLGEAVWTERERQRIGELVAEKYGNRAWNERR